MRVYQVKFIKGVTIVVDGEEYSSDDEGKIVNPPDHVAKMLEGMPDWYRIQGNSPFGPHAIVAHT